jgi:ATP-dependent RNA helicase DHX57
MFDLTNGADNTDDRFLEDFINLVGYHPSANRSGKKQDDDDLLANREEYLNVGLDERSVTAVQAISRSDRVDYAVRSPPRFLLVSAHLRLYGQLITATINHIISKAEQKAGILVFLPGVQEIRQCIDSLQGSPSASQAKIFPLHANLSSDEQRAVFAHTSKWKIVVATNVAEVLIPAFRRVPHIFDLNVHFADFYHHRRHRVCY